MPARYARGSPTRAADSALAGRTHELVWSVVRIVWPGSAEMEQAFSEVVSGLNENLRLAVGQVVKFLEGHVGGSAG